MLLQCVRDSISTFEDAHNARAPSIALPRPAGGPYAVARASAPGLGWSLRGGRLTLTPPLLRLHCWRRVHTRPVEQSLTGEVRLIALEHPVRRDDRISLTEQQ